MKTPIGTALQWKNWYSVENLIFPVISVKSVKMNNFPLKTTGRYRV